MSTHPALYDPATSSHVGNPGDPSADAGHFVPIGWEDVNRGVCPCGELVAWSDELERWIPDRSLVLLVLTPSEVASIMDGAPRGGREVVDLLELEIALNAEIG